ncbi:hypothetical protein VTK73DRAFT_5874 [Phialemonium thermophilum]|uniref:Uncharacterized protein n=1 Tax=Phialemonium thermophilum TaxID=223376 RepID=A0ABR3XWW5_9PEZI
MASTPRICPKNQSLQICCWRCTPNSPGDCPSILQKAKSKSAGTYEYARLTTGDPPEGQSGDQLWFVAVNSIPMAEKTIWTNRMRISTH